MAYDGDLSLPLGLALGSSLRSPAEGEVDLSLLRTLQDFGFRTTRGSVHADKSLVSQDLLWEVPPEGKGHPPNRRQSNS